MPRRCRLTARRQFLTVYAKGRRVRAEAFTLFGLPNDLEVTRLGITVTRKMGGAVVRNRVKRVYREVFRRNRAQLPAGIDVVLNAHPGHVPVSPQALENEFIRCFRLLVRRIAEGRPEAS